MDHLPSEIEATADQPAKSAFGWKRWLKLFLWICILLLAASAGSIGLVLLKYHQVVAARPGRMPSKVEPAEFGRFVNPVIGTGGIPWVCANNSPAAMVPFGMVRLGPETASIFTGRRALNTSGYYYGDDKLLGFSHTRLNGTGATEGGHFLVTPIREAAGPGGSLQRRPTHFTHSEEVAAPGYYAVKLPQRNVLAELTATPRVGVHRYTFAGSDPVHLWIDVSNTLGGRRSTEGKLAVSADKREVAGQIRSFGTFASRYGGLKTYFVARFDQPISGFSTWRNSTTLDQQPTAEGDRVGVDLAFAAGQQPLVITLRLAISYVGIENARTNLDSESTKSFDQLTTEAQQRWEQRLSSIRIQGGSEEQKRIFYTALYRAFEMPTGFNDVNGDYVGFDGKVHRAIGFQYFTDLSLWDTFRTVHPLYTLIAPKEQRDMLVSLTKMLEQGGWLPRWPSGRGYSNSMLGTPADIVIAESYLKGIRDFDIQPAYEAMRRTALAPVPPGSAFSGRQGVEHYLKYGYCPRGLVKGSVSRTFEFGWADQAISELARALGRTEDAELVRRHSQYYRNLWNPQTQYFQPRDEKGRFFEPFKPLLLTYLDRKGELTKDYVEGSALQWRWAAPFDAKGLIALFRSREYFVDELNSFFAKASPALGAWNPGPYYWHGNEPDIHAAYLFNEAGRPDLTQKWVRWILQNKYRDSYDGLDGNDDAGTLSAWYVFSALGFYPIAGSDKYELGAPLFEKAEMNLGTGRLILSTENFAPDHKYVEKIWLNGQLLERSWIHHAEIQNGGWLRFQMAPRPVTSPPQASK